MVIADTKAIQLETIHPDFVTIMLWRQATYSRFRPFFNHLLIVVNGMLLDWWW